MIRAPFARLFAVRARGRLFALAAASLAFLGARDARAQAIPDGNSDGFDTHLFRPALDSKGFFHTNGTDILGKNDLSFGLVIDYGRELLRVRGLGQDQNHLIGHSFQGTASFNYGIANLFVLGLSMPVNLMTGESQVDKQVPPQPTIDTNQWTTNQLDSQTIGFFGLHGKMRLLRVERGFGLALAAQVGAPVTDAPRNAGADPKFFYWPQLIAEKRFGSIGQFKIGANVGFRGHVVSDTTLDLREGRFKDGNRVTYGLGVAYRILEPVDIVADTYATYLLNGDTAGKLKTSNEVVGGLKIFVERNSYLMLGAGSRYTDGFETANVRGFLGFVFEPSIGDRDGDGIKDDVDQCPDEPEDFDGFQDEDGCPDEGDVIVQDKGIVILKKIKFKTNSAEILPESNSILDAVATTINHHPEFTLLEIAGHADERADDAYNLRLTQDRVNSVMAALVKRNVPRDRVRSKGYGEFCPEDPGHNEEAWEKNRRVEFKIVKTKDGPTGVELGCENALKHGVKPDPVP